MHDWATIIDGDGDGDDKANLRYDSRSPGGRAWEGEAARWEYKSTLEAAQEAVVFHLLTTLWNLGEIDTRLTRFPEDFV